MAINKTIEGDHMTITPESRIDTNTAPELETIIKNSLDGITDLVIDLKDLNYISSAGLRVLLSAQKTMNRKGSMVIRNASSKVLEIFEVTGFDCILNIEN